MTIYLKSISYCQPMHYKRGLESEKGGSLGYKYHSDVKLFDVTCLIYFEHEDSNTSFRENRIEDQQGV